MNASDDIVELDPAIFGEDSPCFGCSPHHPIGLKLRFQRQGAVVSTTFVPEERFQGPPGVLHGGLVTTVADELAAWTVVGLKGCFGFTAAIDARLHRPVRVGVETVGRGIIEQDGGRVVKIGITLLQQEKRAFSGTFTFALLDQEAAERVLGGPLPESWVRFSRSQFAGSASE